LHLSAVTNFQWIAAVIISVNMLFSMKGIVQQGQISAKKISASDNLVTEE